MNNKPVFGSAKGGYLLSPDFDEAVADFQEYLSMSRKHVVIAVIEQDGYVALCQRKRGSRYELKWEFPGGKVEEGESAAEALQRELREELCIEASDWRLLKETHSDYADGGAFSLSFFLVRNWKGEMENMVFEDMRWVLPSDILSYDILEGNKEFCRELPELLAA